MCVECVQRGCGCSGCEKDGRQMGKGRKGDYHRDSQPPILVSFLTYTLISHFPYCIL